MELRPIGGRMWKAGAGEDRLREMETIKGALEAMLFVSGEPVTPRRLAEALGCDEVRVISALQELSAEYQAENRGIQLRAVGGGWRLHTHPAYASYVEKLLLSSKRARLTRAAVETLAIIAYLQPITRGQIANLRGVQSENVVKVLVEMGLVAEAGKEKAPGGPALYVTTEKFLEHFGLRSLEELPPLEEFEPDRETVERIARSLSGRADAENGEGAASDDGLPSREEEALGETFGSPDETPGIPAGAGRERQENDAPFMERAGEGQDLPEPLDGEGQGEGFQES
ncbi:SMC-Scp complex subunit ScpB [Candidatus Solincola tengchongensis]|uniref:SMC-Scp complex subunit ScpB n=1 Tax=Candidatus Solincola tengchongensis TaxID=2900693 RepID=UPI0025795F42|nr:SMC-Scp complex subunit ScpB [Candidatus Solincola tengchongensis]